MTRARSGLAPGGVPFAGLERQHAALRPALREAFERVLGASAFILGAEVEAFEREFAEYCGVSHCVGVGSGTAALTIALQAAGVGRGDEIILPAHTFIATALAVLHAGASPVLCDVEEATGLIDADATAAAITPQTAALLPVHLYGQPPDICALRSLAERHSLFILEDAAQAHGARYEGRRAGSLGDAAAFSFYPSKNLGALGDAGAICTDDPALASAARRLRDLGREAGEEHLVTGANERLDGLQAAMLRAKLPHLDRWNAQRRAHADTYRRLLSGRFQTLEEREPARCVYHIFPLRLADRDGAAAILAAAGVQCGVHYPRALHEQPALTGHFAGAAGHPVAEGWAREELSLPMFAELTQDELERVVEVCSTIASERGRWALAS